MSTIRRSLTIAAWRLTGRKPDLDILLQLKEQIASTKQLLQEYEAEALASPDDLSLELRAIRLRERLSSLEKQLREESIKTQRFSHPPGWRLLRFAAFFFSDKIFTNVLVPTIADMRMEYFDALTENRPWKARMVVIQGCWAFWSVIFVQLPISLVESIQKIWRASTK